MRVVALLAAHDEERFVGNCIEHLASQGVETYLIDHESSDATVEIAEGFRGRGLAGIESFPRDGTYSWRRLLARKSELAASLDADWFLHVDADEIRLPPRAEITLAEALAEVDGRGYNAVDFFEFTFVPTLEHPDHDHPRYLETMRWYYPFLPATPSRLNAWKRQDDPVDLETTGGHVIDFPGLHPFPVSFPMRHYLFLSVEHAVRKYVERRYDPVEIEAGLHRARAALRPEGIALRPEAELRRYISDDELDRDEPWVRHPLFSAAEAAHAT